MSLMSKLTVIVISASIVTVHGSVPVHPPPDHPVNMEQSSGVAVIVTDESSLKSSSQTAPHVIPDGLLDTSPTPSPVFSMVNS